MTYEEQLGTAEWLKKRQEIIKRDFSTCQKCFVTEHLNVHHKYYLGGRKAWEYPDHAYITLCNDCHKKEHRLKIIPWRTNDDTMEALWARIRHSAWALKHLPDHPKNG